jgi:hypothetical protein
LAGLRDHDGRVQALLESVRMFTNADERRLSALSKKGRD